jgi:hypothetical protein
VRRDGSCAGYFEETFGFSPKLLDEADSSDAPDALAGARHVIITPCTLETDESMAATSNLRPSSRAGVEQDAKTTTTLPGQVGSSSFATSARARRKGRSSWNEAVQRRQGGGTDLPVESETSAVARARRAESYTPQPGAPVAGYKPSLPPPPPTPVVGPAASSPPSLHMVPRPLLINVERAALWGNSFDLVSPLHAELWPLRDLEATQGTAETSVALAAWRQVARDDGDDVGVDDDDAESYSSLPPSEILEATGAYSTMDMHLAEQRRRAAWEGVHAADERYIDLVGGKPFQLPLFVALHVKKDNAKKHDSHSWFFQRFTEDIRAHFAFCTDCGTQFGPNMLFRLLEHMAAFKHCVGVTGHQTVMSHRDQRLESEDRFEGLTGRWLRAVQQEDFAGGQNLYRGSHAINGMLSVLPGPCAMFRLVAMRPVALARYFAVVEAPPAEDDSIFTANLRIAEDRILSNYAVLYGERPPDDPLQLFVRRRDGKIMRRPGTRDCETHYLNDVAFFFESEGDLGDLVKQRRRWLNGTVCGYVWLVREMFVNWNCCGRPCSKRCPCLACCGTGRPSGQASLSRYMPRRSAIATGIERVRLVQNRRREAMRVKALRERRGCCQFLYDGLPDEKPTPPKPAVSFGLAGSDAAQPLLQSTPLVAEATDAAVAAGGTAVTASVRSDGDTLSRQRNKVIHNRAAARMAKIFEEMERDEDIWRFRPRHHSYVFECCSTLNVLLQIVVFFVTAIEPAFFQMTLFYAIGGLPLFFTLMGQEAWASEFDVWLAQTIAQTIYVFAYVATILVGMRDDKPFDIVTNAVAVLIVLESCALMVLQLAVFLGISVYAIADPSYVNTILQQQGAGTSATNLWGLPDVEWLFFAFGVAAFIMGAPFLLEACRAPPCECTSPESRDSCPSHCERRGCPRHLWICCSCCRVRPGRWLPCECSMARSYLAYLPILPAFSAYLFVYSISRRK